jgi:hypothetical protein
VDTQFDPVSVTGFVEPVARKYSPMFGGPFSYMIPPGTQIAFWLRPFLLTTGVARPVARSKE